jgi:hypothetical protein
MDELYNEAKASRGDRDEILKKSGRNGLLFQQAERWLEWLAARKKISGLSDEIEDTAAKMKEQVARETLGTVMRRAIDAPGLSAREQNRIDSAILEKGCVHREIGFEFTIADGEPDVVWRERLVLDNCPFAMIGPSGGGDRFEDDEAGGRDRQF